MDDFIYRAFAGFLIESQWANVWVGSTHRLPRHGFTGGAAIAVDEDAVAYLQARGGVYLSALPVEIDPEQGPGMDLEPWLTRSIAELTGKLEHGRAVGILSGETQSLAAIWVAARFLCSFWGLSGEQALAYLRGSPPDVREALTSEERNRPTLELPSDVLAGTWFERDILKQPAQADNLIDTYVPWVHQGSFSMPHWQGWMRLLQNPDTPVEDVKAAVHALERRYYETSALSLYVLHALKGMYMLNPSIDRELFFQWLSPEIQEDVFTNPAVIFWMMDITTNPVESMKLTGFAQRMMAELYQSKGTWDDMRLAARAWSDRTGATWVRLPSMLSRARAESFLDRVVYNVAQHVLSERPSPLWRLQALFEIEDEVRAQMGIEGPYPLHLGALRALVPMDTPIAKPRPARGRKKA